MGEELPPAGGRGRGDGASQPLPPRGPQLDGGRGKHVQETKNQRLINLSPDLFTALPIHGLLAVLLPLVQRLVHVGLDLVHLILEFELLALEEGDIEVLPGVASGQVSPTTGLTVKKDSED